MTAGFTWMMPAELTDLMPNFSRNDLLLWILAMNSNNLIITFCSNKIIHVNNFYFKMAGKKVSVCTDTCERFETNLKNEFVELLIALLNLTGLPLNTLAVGVVWPIDSVVIQATFDVRFEGWKKTTFRTLIMDFRAILNLLKWLWLYPHLL